MKKASCGLIIVLILSILIALIFVLKGCGSTSDESEPKIQVRFSPKGGCQEQIIYAIHKAKTSILVQAYSFTSLPIGQALIEEKERGREVLIILDRSNEKSPDSMIHLMMEHQIPIYIDSAHAISHNKILLVDKLYVVTGSFNFTKAANESNAENCLLITDKDISISYIDNWLKHKEHSKLF